VLRERGFSYARNFHCTPFPKQKRAGAIIFLERKGRRNFSPLMM
jgi:hypothetical protein